jgi:hypothetical protein
VQLNGIHSLVQFALGVTSRDLFFEIFIGRLGDPCVDLYRLSRTSRSWIARSSLPCVAGLISPISPTKNVPDTAATSNPSLSFTAPANDPFTSPKS